MSVIIILIVIIIIIIVIIIRVPRDCSVEGTSYVYELIAIIIIIIIINRPDESRDRLGGHKKFATTSFYSFGLVCAVMNARVECRVFNTKVLFILSIYRIHITI